MTSAPPGETRATGQRLDPKYAPLLIPAIAVSERLAPGRVVTCMRDLGPFACRAVGPLRGW